MNKQHGHRAAPRRLREEVKISMSDSDIQMILRRLEVMDQARQHDVERLHAKLDALSVNGCAKAAYHSAIDADHEARLRDAERYIQRQAGQTALIGGGAGVGAGILIGLGKLLLTKLWG